MTFNFKALQRRYDKGKKSEEEKEQQQLLLFEDVKINPLVGEHVAKIRKEYQQFYNNNRNFYLHALPGEIDTSQHLKHSNFAQIRKELDLSLLPAKQTTKLVKGSQLSPKKKKALQMVQKEMKLRHYSYLFRKNIKLIIKKLQALKITMNDIFERKLFSKEPYAFGKEVFEAVKSGDDAMFWRIYTQNRFIIYGVDSTGKTLLVWGCIRGHVSIVEMLLGMGALTKTSDLHGRSALYYAMYYDHAECVKRLLLWGAIPSEKEIRQVECSKRIKSMIQLSRVILPIIWRMSLQRKTAIFQDRLKYYG